jgi:hypothetical protein
VAFPRGAKCMNTPRAADATTEEPLKEPRICILHVPDCPLVGRLRIEVEMALKSIGTTAVIQEIKGSYSSPTLLVDGVEIDGYPLGTEPACRIGLPTREQIVAAILAAGIGGTDRARIGGCPE